MVIFNTRKIKQDFFHHYVQYQSRVEDVDFDMDDNTLYVYVDYWEFDIENFSFSFEIDKEGHVEGFKIDKYDEIDVLSCWASNVFHKDSYRDLTDEEKEQAISEFLNNQEVGRYLDIPYTLPEGYIIDLDECIKLISDNFIVDDTEYTNDNVIFTICSADKEEIFECSYSMKDEKYTVNLEQGITIEDTDLKSLFLKIYDKLIDMAEEQETSVYKLCGGQYGLFYAYMRDVEY